MKKELLAELNKPFVNGLPEYLRIDGLCSNSTHIDLMENFAQRFNLYTFFGNENNKRYIKGSYISYYPSQIEYDYFIERRNYYLALQEIVNELIENFDMRLKELNTKFYFDDMRDYGRNEVSFFLGENKNNKISFQLNFKTDLPEIRYNNKSISFDELLEKMCMD